MLSVIRDNEIAFVTISTGNSLNGASYDDLADLYSALQAMVDPQSGFAAVVLQGKPGFLGGLLPCELSDFDHVQGERISQLGQSVCNLIEDAPIPFLAAVDGLAIGGGMEIAMACDFIVATERSIFIQVETEAGLVPGFGGTWRLPRHVGPQRARWMAYTACPVTGTQAAAWGLVLELATEAELLTRCKALAADITKTSRQAVSHVKRLLSLSSQTDRQTSNHAEREAFAALFSTSEMHQRMQRLCDTSISFDERNSQ